MKLRKILLKSLIVIAIIIVVIVGIITAYSLLYINGIIFNGDAEKITKDILVSVKIQNNAGGYDENTDGILINKTTVVTTRSESYTPKTLILENNGVEHKFYLYKQIDENNICIYKIKAGEYKHKIPAMYTAIPLKGDIVTIGYYDNGNYTRTYANYLGWGRQGEHKMYVCDKLKDNLNFRPVFDKYGRIVGISRNIYNNDYSLIIPYIDILGWAI